MFNYREGVYRGLRTFYQTLGSTLAGLQVADVISTDLAVGFAVKIAAAVGSAALAGAVAFFQNVSTADTD